MVVEGWVSPCQEWGIFDVSNKLLKGGGVKKSNFMLTLF